MEVFGGSARKDGNSGGDVAVERGHLETERGHAESITGR